MSSKHPIVSDETYNAAFRQGVEAFELGHSRRDNPYRERPLEYEFWNDGWRHGYLEYLYEEDKRGK